MSFCKFLIKNKKKCKKLRMMIAVKLNLNYQVLEKQIRRKELHFNAVQSKDKLRNNASYLNCNHLKEKAVCKRLNQGKVTRFS